MAVFAVFVPVEMRRLLLALSRTPSNTAYSNDDISLRGKKGVGARRGKRDAGELRRNWGGGERDGKEGEREGGEEKRV